MFSLSGTQSQYNFYAAENSYFYYFSKITFDFTPSNTSLYLVLATPVPETEPSKSTTGAPPWEEMYPESSPSSHENLYPPTAVVPQQDVFKVPREPFTPNDPYAHPPGTPHPYVVTPVRPPDSYVPRTGTDPYIGRAVPEFGPRFPTPAPRTVDPFAGVRPPEAYGGDVYGRGPRREMPIIARHYAPGVVSDRFFTAYVTLLYFTCQYPNARNS